MKRDGVNVTGPNYTSGRWPYLALVTAVTLVTDLQKGGGDR